MKKTGLLIGLMLGLFACAPKWYMAKPKEIEQFPYGLHFIGYGEKFRKHCEGEIIYLKGDTLALLPQDEGGALYYIVKDDIDQAEVKVALSSNHAHAIGALHLFNTITPLSHGYFIFFTWPINIVIGSIISYNAALKSYVVIYPDHVTWDELAHFARFPMGLPPGIRPEDIEDRVRDESEEEEEWPEIYENNWE